MTKSKSDAWTPKPSFMCYLFTLNQIFLCNTGHLSLEIRCCCASFLRTLLLQQLCTIVRNSVRESQTSKGRWNHLGRLGYVPTIFFYSCIFSSLCLEEFSLWLPEENLFYKKYAPNQIFIASATPASHLPKRTHAFHEFFSAQEAIYKFLAS